MSVSELLSGRWHERAPRMLYLLASVGLMTALRLACICLVDNYVTVCISLEVAKKTHASGPDLIMKDLET